jgi:menaquinone-dependent protoporphyrinogen oxidase
VADVLVIYASTHGHTAKIAGRVADGVRAAGLEADVCDVARAGDTDPAPYNGIVVGASIHRLHHQPEMVEWVKTHRTALAERPSTFLSVSLTAAEDTDEAQETTQRCIDDFVEETGWSPARSVPVAGALQYREYDVFTRTLMRLLMKRGGRPTDTRQDYDYTAWDAVERLGREFGAMVASGTK